MEAIEGGAPARVRRLVAHDVGVAMDTPQGLVVPVVRGAEQRSVPEIAAELARLRDAALAGRLSREDIRQPSFTLSNIGSLGGTYMSPLIAPPQVATGAIGRARRLPRFKSEDSDQVVAQSIAAVSWAGDHRVLDGATMARFSNRVKQLVQDPIHFLNTTR